MVMVIAELPQCAGAGRCVVVLLYASLARSVSPPPAGFKGARRETTMANPKFDPKKALEVLLYVTPHCPDMYTALKVVYFADKLHLSRYGRLIAGERYVAMSHGPVPSGLYDMVKSVRGDGVFTVEVPAKEAFTMVDYNINPLRRADLDVLSESDRECLDEAIREYGHKSFAELKEISHRDTAFQAADENDFITMEALAKSLPNGEALLEYLNE